MTFCSLIPGIFCGYYTTVLVDVALNTVLRLSATLSIYLSVRPFRACLERLFSIDRNA